MSAAADDTMADVPPLPPVVLPIDDTTAAAAAAVDFEAAAQVPTLADDPNNNAAAEVPIQQDEEPSPDNGLVNLEGIMTELLSLQSENNGSLAIPSSHPVSY